MADNTQKGQSFAAYTASPDYVSSSIPLNVRQDLANYKADENETNRNKVFQSLWKQNSQVAGAKLGDENFQSYDGMRQAVNEAYPVTPMGFIMDGLKAMDYRNNQGGGGQPVVANNAGAVNNIPGRNMPGANTGGALGILHR